MNYRQNNIFKDPLHEEMLKHENSLPMNQIKIDFQNLNIDFKDLNYIGNLINKNANVLNNNLNVINDNAKNENQIFNINVGNHNDQITSNKNIMKDFKKLLYQNKDIVYHFYNYLAIKIRIKRKNEYETNNNEESQIKGKKNNLTNTRSLMTKEEFIKSYNKNYFDIINKTNSKVEFHILFGANVIQTVSICEICSKPNTLWDVRKEFQFSKNKRETRTICKYCNMQYVPYFMVIDEQIVEKLIEKKNKKIDLNNKSFDENSRNKSMSDLNDNGSNKFCTNQNQIKKIEYMSFEHMIYQYLENDVQINQDNTIFTNNRNKRFSSNINFVANRRWTSFN